MSDGPKTQGSFTIPAAREALRFLRKKGSGALLVTSGLSDIRLVVEARRVSVEAEGTPLHGEEERDLVRSFLSAVFWEQPTFFLDPGGRATPSAASIVLQASQYEVLNLMDRGLEELIPVQDRVSGMDLLATVSGDPPPDTTRSPTANLFRVLARTPKGGHLGSAAEQARLDVLDAAWSISDLLESNRVVLRRPSAPMIMRRLMHAEAFADRGLLPAARFIHIARGFTRTDTGRAARLFQDAAANFLIGGHADQALQSFRNCLELAADNVAALEGMANALEELGRNAESKRIREKLVKLYLAWSMPSRARQQLERIPQQTAEQRAVLLDCMLRMRDFQSATVLAKRLIPSLPSGEKIELAGRFARFGARGKELDAIVSLCGLHSLGFAKTALKLLTVVAVLLCVILGVEAVVRSRYSAAVDATLPKIAQAEFSTARGDWDDLGGWDAKLGASQAAIPFTSLSKIEAITEGLGQLQQDLEMLRKSKETRELLGRWDELTPARHSADIGADLAALGAIEAESVQLKERIAKSLGNIDAYRTEAEGLVRAYKELAKPLEAAQTLLRDYANVREYSDKPDLFNLSGTPGSGLVLSIKVKVAPNEGVMSWRIPPEEKWHRFRNPAQGGAGVDTWAVRLPFASAAEGMVLKATHGRGYVGQELLLKIAELDKTVVDLKLMRLSVQNKELSLLPPSDSTVQVVFVETKKGGDWPINFAKHKIVPDPGFESTDFGPLLTPVLPKGYVVYIEFESHSSQYTKTEIYTKQINIWLHDDQGNEARTRRVDELGISGRDGLLRPVEEQNPGLGDWIVRSIDGMKNTSRRDRTKEAIVAAVKVMVRELKKARKP
jgi:hypothetical protein